jgi:alkanesulfonate monooxygenase SsuD/methylene tetrahydromethanopterin reductase-like flavin-dependent oxidoreductase (luciferase family)
MKFGVHNPSWIYGPDPSEAFDGFKVKAQWAENNGFVWFSVMDHLIQIGGVATPTEPFMQGWTVLSALAAVTSRIRLATLAASVTYRNPAHLAKIGAGVHQIGRGRMTLGIGAGWFEGQYKQYGWEFPPGPRRASGKWRKPSNLFRRCGASRSRPFTAGISTSRKRSFDLLKIRTPLRHGQLPARNVVLTFRRSDERFPAAARRPAALARQSVIHASQPLSLKRSRSRIASVR